MDNKVSNGNGVAELERRLWSAADPLRANSPLCPSEYSTPVLGLKFLRFADDVFTKAEADLQSHRKNPTTEISTFGQERLEETFRLCKMNFAVQGLNGGIREANTYYEAVFDRVGRFDCVMTNPPFNVSGVDKEKLEDDPRVRPDLPSTDNANYLWIQMFYHTLSPKGRGGFVMANSAANARGSELEMPKKLIQSGSVDVIVSVGLNFSYTVTLPATLWFFDKGKAAVPPPKPPAAATTTNQDTLLFVDARHIVRQIDRAHREFTPEQAGFLANIVRLYRGKEPEWVRGSEKLLKEKFPKVEYADGTLTSALLA